MIPIGFVGRFLGSNPKPVVKEATFARQVGFDYIEFISREDNPGTKRLGLSPIEVKRILDHEGLTAAMEIVIRIGDDGRTASGNTPLEIYQANLSTIADLGCSHVHLHLTPMLEESLSNASVLEKTLLPQFEEAVRIAALEGFSLGFEHNDPDLFLYADPIRCQWVLESVPDLKFVWDSNHIHPEHWAGYEPLLPRAQMLHISDTPLPEVNHHLPLGEGNIDWSMVKRMLAENGFQGPAILEIGGNPKSGGFGGQVLFLVEIGRAQSAESG